MNILHDHVKRFTLVLAFFVWMWGNSASNDIVSKTLFLQLTSNGTDLNDLLNFVTEVNNNQRCVSSENLPVVEIPIRTQRFDVIQSKVDLVSRVIKDDGIEKAKQFIPSLLKNIVLSESEVYGSEMFLIQRNRTNFHVLYEYMASAYRIPDSASNFSINVNEALSVRNTSVFNTSDKFIRTGKPRDFLDHKYSKKALGNWTLPYYSCKYKRWITTYTVPLPFIRRNGSASGTFEIDIDLSYLDINQCDVEFSNIEENDEEAETYAEIPLSQIVSFRGTHKCDRNTSTCIFMPSSGWTRGSYLCQCKDGYYSTTQNPIFNGTAVENAWKEKISFSSATYSLIYVCKQCPPGCDTCKDGSPCLAEYNWPFRISLLTISVICILLTILLMCYVYSYRKLKVIKVASPIFLCITLVGAVIMYMEMAAIFPVLDMYSCIATKWTRHLGFCITYSALLLKTWRVSLTYRVKSAHKIKLTDKQLLQWLFPILLVMVIYLSTWTVSSPPHSVYIKDYNGLKLKQCTYDWWDHSLAIGEILFLLWGIRVCYTVRKAESFFNEAKHISYAIYSITLVNIIMVTIHLMIFPTAPPDLKYLFGFIRTQLSTTATILLVFGPKFYRVIKGQGDVYDNRARARGVTASFSLNGIGLVHEEPTDLFHENEELKEEIQKLAAQIEFMKIVHMEMNNRHIKPKVGGYFSQSAVNSTQSPVGKAIYMKFDSSDSPTSRISPAAELVSERV